MVSGKANQWMWHPTSFLSLAGSLLGALINYRTPHVTRNMSGAEIKTHHIPSDTLTNCLLIDVVTPPQYITPALTPKNMMGKKISQVRKIHVEHDADIPTGSLPPRVPERVVCLYFIAYSWDIWALPDWHG